MKVIMIVDVPKLTNEAEAMAYALELLQQITEAPINDDCSIRSFGYTIRKGDRRR